MRERWYDRTTDEVGDMLKTDLKKGLGRSEAAKRLKTDGRNVVYPHRREPLRGYLRAVLTDLSALLFLATVILGLIYRKDAGLVVILVILLVNYGVAIAYFLRSRRILEDMGLRALPRAKVMRAGKLMTVPSEELVMGDLILISHGDIVPADARLIESEGLRVYEGGLFDVRNVSKKDASYFRAGAQAPQNTPNMVYASTVVTGGKATAAVIATGEDNLVCRLGKNRPIAACHKLEILKNVRRISIGAGVLLLIPALILTALSLYRGGEVMQTLTLCLAFAVSAMPELYAAFSYVIVSFGMRAAMEEGKNGSSGAFIKNPLSLPALGEIDALFVPIEKFRPAKNTKLFALSDGFESCPVGDAQKNERFLRVLRFGLVSTGQYGGRRLTEQNERGENIRTPEEDALIRSGEDLNLYDRTLEDRFPIFDHRGKGEDGSLFDTTLVRYMSENLVVLRGQAGQVLDRCTHYCRNGRVAVLDGDTCEAIRLRAREFIREGMTPLAVATKRNEYNSLLRIVDSQTALTFEGFLILEKPLLSGCAQTVSKLREAGVSVIAYSRRENEEYGYLSRALGIVKKDREAVRASDIADQSEEIFIATAKGYTFFEGFDEMQMRYVVELFKNEYKKKPGYFAERMEGVYPMYSACVGFAEEDGTTLGGGSGRTGELRSPLWVRKSSQHELYSCQALSHVSDVILPPAGSGARGTVSENGRDGGVNSISSAIRFARVIYRNIRLLILYLSCTCGLRFLSLLTFVSENKPGAVQLLLSGMIFDLIAVFVIAQERPDGVFMRVDVRRKLSRIVLFEILPALVSGVAAGALILLFTSLLGNAGLFSSEALGSVRFLSCVALQAAVLTAFLRTGRTPFKNVRFSVSYLVYLIFTFSFFLLAFLVPQVGALFFLTAPGAGGVLAALILPAGALLLFFVIRQIFSKIKKRNRFSRKGKNG